MIDNERDESKWERQVKKTRSETMLGFKKIFLFDWLSKLLKFLLEWFIILLENTWTMTLLISLNWSFFYHH